MEIGNWTKDDVAWPFKRESFKDKSPHKQQPKQGIEPKTILFFLLLIIRMI